jgi:hypothetical protein
VVRVAGRTAEAKHLYERAIVLSEPGGSDGTADNSQRFLLACSLRRIGQTLCGLGDCAGASANVRRSLALFDGLSTEDGYEFESASCHATLAGLSERPGSGVLAAEGKMEADKAMKWLARAVATGYRNVNELRIESAFDSLRNREDFKKLIADLEAKPARN